MTKEIEDRVDAILAASFIDIKVTLVGPTKRDGMGTTPWECDQWHVVMSWPPTPKDKHTFDFYTGTGRRKRDAMDERHFKAHLDNLGKPTPMPGSIGYRNVERLYPGKPVVPKAASVLHSLLLDARAIDQSFDDWCDDYGSDKDSIKALNTYQTCCETGRKLRSMPRAAVAELRDALQDY
ncbi:MAG: hypothetical protein ACSLE8_06225 [Rhodococcus sp. (in: high G+C Gram-positive bacteria)]